MHRALQTGSDDDFATYDAIVNERSPYAIRDLLRFTTRDVAISIEDVEPIEECWTQCFFFIQMDRPARIWVQILEIWTRTEPGGSKSGNIFSNINTKIQRENE